MLKLIDLLNLPASKKTSGEYGVEVEVEGRQVCKDLYGKELNLLWTTVEDNSLRGESCEYIFRKPLPYEEAKVAVEKLYKDLLYKSDIDPSIRCGIHVHYNVQQYTVIELWNLVCSFIVFEELLVRFCGPSREGNLFCMRAKDAEYLLHLMRDSIETNNLKVLDTPYIRYASINLMSLFKFGSVEFRTLPTTKTHEPVLVWLDILKDLITFAKRLKYPTDLLPLYSDAHAEGLVVEAFPNTSEHLVRGIGSESINSMVRAGYRKARLLAKTIKWESIDKEIKSVFPKVTAKIGSVQKIVPVLSCKRMVKAGPLAEGELQAVSTDINPYDINPETPSAVNAVLYSGIFRSEEAARVLNRLQPGVTLNTTAASTNPAPPPTRRRPR